MLELCRSSFYFLQVLRGLLTISALFIVMCPLLWSFALLFKGSGLTFGLCWVSLLVSRKVLSA